ncbi:MAG TPA: ATP-binding protein [Saccharospirillum sp.]|nr:ATP-binding protein [Saccharospirillum sp.]
MKGAVQWLPRSLFARLLLVMLSGVCVAQILTSLIWAGQLDSDSRARVAENARYLATTLTATIRYFQALPDNVRPIVIDQQREVGGSRLFMSVNQQLVSSQSDFTAPLKSAFLTAIDDQLSADLGQSDVQLALAMPDDVRVYDQRTPIAEIPIRWIRQSLILEPEPAPILTVQVPLSNGEWLYLATLLPDPYILDKNRVLTRDRWWSLGMTLLVVGVLGFLFVRWQTRPLRRLAEAADSFGRGVAHEPLAASGMRELDATAEAFSAMEMRIQRYLDDRERLFAAISHDLRTPITRLRLQTEMIEDDTLRLSLEEDLEELDIMVKGALQTVRNADIHEDPKTIDLGALVNKIASEKHLGGHRVRVHQQEPVEVLGKPLALKRCLTNLIDNAVFYGDQAVVTLTIEQGQAIVRIRDRGPGLGGTDPQRLFKPYTRLAHGQARNASGMGLGLGIAQSIVHGHGGELQLSDHPEGGLEVTLMLPRDYTVRRETKD